MSGKGVWETAWPRKRLGKLPGSSVRVVRVEIEERR
jgi:hypothetical protein